MFPDVEVNTPSAEADGFTGPLEVGQRRLTPTGERAGIAMPRVDGHEPPIRGRLLQGAPVNHLPFRDRAQARLNGLLMQPAPRGFMLKLSPEGEGFNPPKVGQ